MKIARHRLSRSERQAVVDIVDRLPCIVPDTMVAPENDRPALLVSNTIPGFEKDYRVDFAACSADLEALESLKHFLARVAQVPPASPIVVLEGLPVERNAAALLLLVGSLIGKVREYLGHGAPVVEVSDHSAASSGRPTSDNNIEFKLHTDMSFYARPPALAAFLMLNPARVGGESTFCDPLPIIGRLPDWAVSQLRRPFEFSAPPHMKQLGPQHFPILDCEDIGKLKVRYRGDGLTATDSNQASALAAWEHDLARSEIEVPLEQGEMAVFSNTRLLHGRRGFHDSAETGHKRMALRAYIELPPNA